MIDLLSKLNASTDNKQIEPREIFMSLPKKDKQYEYPRDVQSEVWKKWYEKRNGKNVIIKMNTGSGKTVVGLMILQSCLNEGKGPAVYVVPDKYLVSQVIKEASKLGIKAVDNRDDYYYQNEKAILVMPIHSLVNGLSVFGMRENDNYPIGSIIVDDVHSCLDTICSQFSINIPNHHDLYNKILKILKTPLENYNKKVFDNIALSSDPHERLLVPFWIWKDCQERIFRTIKGFENNLDDNKFILFSLPLLSRSFSMCNCVITSRSIEITPKGTSISLISSFEKAQRRIFMSATLSDDSVFVSAIGLKPDDITDIISPEKANDIGNRLMLFPKHLNNKITDDEVRKKVFEISKEYNVIVIVPSYNRGLFWDDTGKKIIDKESISDVVDELKKKHIGLLVFVNRYDGIDLPEDACRMLVIDGLPPLRSEYDKYVHSIDKNSKIIVKEQIQRIEQGMGRGVRSNSDSCCIIFMGNNLADVLIRQKGIVFFSKATETQYNLSKKLWDLLKEESPTPTIDEIFEIANYSLENRTDWIEMNKSELSQVKYNTKPSFNNNTIAIRQAYDWAILGQIEKAIEIMNSAIYSEESNETKAYLMQLKAEYVNEQDASQAQEILLSARKMNAGVLPPISGVQYSKVLNNITQSKAIVDYIRSQSLSPNDYILYVNAILDRLSFSNDPNDFELAMQEIGLLLGFKSTRPDKETGGAGCDNLWAIGDNSYLVIECKSAAIVDTISKEYCNQLGGSIRWFETAYGDDYTKTPVMIHPSIFVDRLATAPTNMRIINEKSLNKIKNSLNGFSIAVVQANNWCDEGQINNLLKCYYLRNCDLISNYTLAYKNK